jgi:hypothetical protein
MNSIVVNKKSTNQYDIIFCGLREGVDVEKVEYQFSLLFGYTERQVKKIVARKRITLKTNMSEKTAKRFVHCLQMMGAVVELSQVFVDIGPEHINGTSDVLSLLSPLCSGNSDLQNSVDKQQKKISTPRTQGEKLANVQALELKLQQIKIAKAKKYSNNSGIAVARGEPLTKEKIYPAIRTIDNGEESVEASSMHQYVDCAKADVKVKRYWVTATAMGALVILLMLAAVIYYRHMP